MWIDRRTGAERDAGVVWRIINLGLTPVEYRTGGPRSPFRVQVVDAAGNHASLVYFGKAQGWARKLLPIGEPRLVSGKLELYGQNLQIVHPDNVLAPDRKSTRLNSSH